VCCHPTGVLIVSLPLPRPYPDGRLPCRFKRLQVDGTHLGHDVPDQLGSRYCINVVSVAGLPMADGRGSASRDASSLDGATFTSTASQAAVTSKLNAVSPHDTRRPNERTGCSHPSAECSHPLTDCPHPSAGCTAFDLPPVTIVPLSGDEAIVGHTYEGVACSVAEAVRERLGPRARVHQDWHTAPEGVVVLFVVEVESDGAVCEAGRKWMLHLKRSPDSLLGGTLRGKAVGVLGIARSVCAFSAASGGPEKYSGALRFQRALLQVGCELLVEMGCAEVETEELDVQVLPWADGVSAAFEARLADKIAALSAVEPAVKSLEPANLEQSSVTNEGQYASLCASRDATRQPPETTVQNVRSSMELLWIETRESWSALCQKKPTMAVQLFLVGGSVLLASWLARGWSRSRSPWGQR